MLSFHKKYERNKFSQNGEDGIIEEICKRLDITKGVVVEFGAHNGTYCSNSREKILAGWTAILIEADPALYKQLFTLYKKPSDLAFNKPNPPIPETTLFHRFVTPENVNDLLPRQIDVLSIDVDGIDYNIWKAYTGHATAVIIEINSSLDPLVHIAGDPQIGSSYAAMVELGAAKGYTLVCHCGNLIFVDSNHADLFPELAGKDPIGDLDEYFNTSWRAQA